MSNRSAPRNHQDPPSSLPARSRRTPDAVVRPQPKRATPASTTPGGRKTAGLDDPRTARAEAESNTRAVIDLLQNLGRVQTPNEAAMAALASVRAAFGWAYGSFWTLDRTSASMRCSGESGTVNAAFQAATQAASFREGQGLVGGAWQRREMFFVEDVRSMKGFGRAAAAQAGGIVSALCLPLFSGKDVIGAIDFFARERLTPSPSRLAVLGSIGGLVSQTLERIRELERQRDVAADTLAVNRVLETVGGATDPGEAVRAALESARVAFGWSYGSYWTLDRDAGLLRFAVDSGDVNVEFRSATHRATFAEGAGLVGAAWKRRDMVFVEDLEKMPGFARAASARQGGIRSAVCLPLVVDDQVIGALDFFSQRAIHPTATRLEALQNVGRLVSAALARIAAQTRERRQAEDLRSKVDRILSVVNRAAVGDLTGELTIDGSDAVGLLSESLARFLSDLRGSIAGIAANGETVASSSEELTATARQMRAAATGTADQAAMVSGAAEQVSRNIQAVAASAEQMSASVGEISKNVAAAAHVASDGLAIAEATNATVSRLGQSSKEIGNVVAVIATIAQQTNMLALNAAIEAARAGEAGRGFAVVAHQVKQLAKETSDATDDIGRKVKAIQAETKSAMTAIAEIGGVIAKISGIQTAISGAVEEQTTTTTEIGRNVSEAAMRASEIASSIAGVAAAAGSTRTGATDTEEASAGLAKMAAEMQTLIARFKY